MPNIFFNHTAFGGASRKKLKKLGPEFKEIKGYNPTELDIAYEQFLISEQNNSIVVGGDGSIHHFINKVWSRKRDIALGLIGVGSSNSLLRSLSSKHKGKNHFRFTDFTHSQKLDIGQLQLDCPTLKQNLFFIANSSIGFLALGNEIFNQSSGILKVLKKISTELVNTLVFFKTLMRYKPQTIRMSFDSYSLNAKFLNIQILKANYYSGNYHFESSNAMDSGFFEIHLFLYESLWKTMLTFFYLTLNRPEKIKNHFTYLTREISVESETDILIEADGEIFRSRKLKYLCLEKAINIAGHC